MAENKKLSIIAFSGDFDKLTAVFTLGTGAAAVGYEVNIFFQEKTRQKLHWWKLAHEALRIHDGRIEGDTNKPFQLPRCRTQDLPLSHA